MRRSCPVSTVWSLSCMSAAEANQPDRKAEKDDIAVMEYVFFAEQCDIFRNLCCIQVIYHHRSIVPGRSVMGFIPFP